MAGKTKKKFKITKVSLDDLSNTLDRIASKGEFLTYIDEHKDSWKIFIYLIQNYNSHSNKIVAYTSTFKKLKDLEDKLVLIHKIIADNCLGYNNNFSNKLRDVTRKIIGLRYTDLREINKLEKVNKIYEYQVSLESYNKIYRELKLIFADICELYEHKLHIEYVKKFGLERYTKFFTQVRRTPQLGVDTHIGEFMDNYAEDTGSEGFLDDRASNIKKIKKFNKDTEKYKKESND